MANSIKENNKYLFVNVDVDSLKFYYQIHGLKENNDNIIWELGVKRFLRFFKTNNIKANFFIIGSDLKNLQNLKIAKEIIKNGHKINSHTFSHEYNLIKKNKKHVEREIKKNQDLLKKELSINNICFRGPGYEINDKIYKILKKNKIKISSTLLPSSFYYILKNIIIIKNKFFFKNSKSLLGNIFASLKPKKMFFEKFSNILEIPITTIPLLSIPFIGTFIVFMGNFGFFLFKEIIIKKEIINLEFHAIDLVDSEDLINHRLLNKKQFDLKYSHKYKQKLFIKWIKYISKSHNNILLEDILKLKSH
tara:strand:+ start:1970 stop:2887 length:918 start_codon:yes stop_codon:yes gene_type:complete